MKTRTLKALCTATVIAAAAPLFANEATVDSLKTDFAHVRALELPARVASVVTAAKPADRQATAQDAVRAALSVNASVAPMVVGAVAKANPDVAGVSAVTASSMEPKELSKIARAAVGAAPSEVEGIVTALTTAQPSSFLTVGLAAAHVAPTSGDAILRGIGASSPALKTLIARATPKGAVTKEGTTVAAILKRVQTMVATLSNGGNTDTLLAGSLSAETLAKLPASMGALALTAPSVGPPYVPGSPSPGEITTSQTFQAPPNTRIYSAP